MHKQHRRNFALRKTILATAIGATVAPAFGQELMLEEVIVTATKRAATIQDISGTVNVVTGDAIDRLAAFEFLDVEQQTAGLTLSSPNARNSSIAMRGISIDPESGASGVVSVFWNDQVVRTDIAFGRMYPGRRCASAERTAASNPSVSAHKNR